MFEHVIFDQVDDDLKNVTYNSKGSVVFANTILQNMLH